MVLNGVVSFPQTTANMGFGFHSYALVFGSGLT